MTFLKTCLCQLASTPYLAFYLTLTCFKPGLNIVQYTSCWLAPVSPFALSLSILIPVSSQSHTSVISYPSLKGCGREQGTTGGPGYKKHSAEEYLAFHFHLCCKLPISGGLTTLFSRQRVRWRQQLINLDSDVPTVQVNNRKAKRPWPVGRGWERAERPLLTIMRETGGRARELIAVRLDSSFEIIFLGGVSSLSARSLFLWLRPNISVLWNADCTAASKCIQTLNVNTKHHSQAILLP